MPTYQYRCTACGHDLEAVQKFSDAALTECPSCGGQLRKVYNAVGVVFKGSGFYRTDSRSADGKGEGSDGASKGSDGGSESGSAPAKEKEKAGSAAPAAAGAAGASSSGSGSSGSGSSGSGSSGSGSSGSGSSGSGSSTGAKAASS
jgi:putative FmdB family regulatory protein